MKYLVLIIGLAWGVVCFGQTPTYAKNGAGCPINTVSGGPTDAVTSYRCPLPNPTGNGNLLVIWLRYNNANSPTVSFTTNLGALSPATAVTQVDGTTTSRIYYVANVAAGINIVTVNFSANASFVQMQPYEFYNVATATPLEATSSAIGTGTTVTSGTLSGSSLTTGDLIVHFGFYDALGTGVAQTSCAVGSQPSITWTARACLVSATEGTPANQEPMFFQYGVYNATAVFAPSMTFAPVSSNYVSLSAAFKSATAGTAPPSGIRVNYIQHDDGGNINASSETLMLPISGNLAVEVYTGGCNSTTLASCSYATAFSGMSGAWAQIGTTQVYALGGAPQAVVGSIWYAKNITTAGLYPITLTTNVEGLGANFPSSYMMFDISGASANPLDVAFGGNSNGLATMGASAANWSSGSTFSTFGGSNPVTPTVTPSQQNEVILSAIGAESGTFTGPMVSPAGSQFIASWYTNESNFSWEDLNGGWAIYYNNASTAPETWTWSWASLGSPSQTSPGRGLGIAAAFESPATSTTGSLVPTPGWQKIPNTAMCGGGAESNPAYMDPITFPANIGSFTGYGTNNLDCVSGFRDSNSAAYDTTRHRMIYWGGGHVGYWRNDAWSLEMTQVNAGTTNNFGVVSPMYHLDHTANQNTCPSSGGASTTVTTANGGVCQYNSSGQLQNVFALDKCVYTSGCTPTGVTPGTVHDYEALTYSPINDEVVLLGGGGTTPLGFGSNNGWALAMSSVLPSCAPTGTQQGCNPVWSALGNTAANNFFSDPGNVGKVNVYDPNSQGIWMQTQNNLWFFNPANGTITQKSTNGNGSHFSGAFDSYHNYFVFAGDNAFGGFRYINIGAGGVYPLVTPTTTGCSAALTDPESQYPGMAWDPVDRRVVIYPNRGNGTLYILDPATWTCTTEIYGTTIGVDIPQNTPICTSPCGQQGTFNHFAYDPGLDVFVLWNDPSNDAWYLRRRRGNMVIIH